MIYSTILCGYFYVVLKLSREILSTACILDVNFRILDHRRIIKSENWLSFTEFFNFYINYQNLILI